MAGQVAGDGAKETVASNAKLHQRHDVSFRFLLSSKQLFMELLRSFVRLGWVEAVNEADMEEVPRSFVLPDFKRKEADLIYRARANGQEIVFYVLMELQSRVDYLMPYRLLLYMVEIWRYVLKDVRRSRMRRQDFRLPAIVPIVLYNGRNRWTASRSLRGMVANERLFGGQVVDFEYILIDVARYSEEQLLSLANTIGAVFLIEQANDREQLLNRLRKLMGTIRDMPEEKQQLFVAWIANVIAGKLPAVGSEVKAMLDNRKKEVPMMGLEKVLDDIKREGKKEGKREGREEGYNKGREAVARNLIEMGLDSAAIARATGFPLETIERMML